MHAVAQVVAKRDLKDRRLDQHLQGRAVELADQVHQRVELARRGGDNEGVLLGVHHDARRFLTTKANWRHGGRAIFASGRFARKERVQRIGQRGGGPVLHTVNEQPLRVR